jgi:hypothetical protein
VFSVTGVSLGSVDSISELEEGVFILEITYADGSVDTTKIVK